MNKARLAVALVGILLPYAARLPRGAEWIGQYTSSGLGGALFLGGFNAIAWGSILLVSLLYRRPASLLVPAIGGFGFLAWAHYNLDLASDAQAAIALVFIPIYAVPVIAVSGAIGYLLDRRLRVRGAAD